MSIGILLSGGMDSVALTYWKRPDVAFTIDYGQRGFKGELRAARTIAKRLTIPHEVLSVDCGDLGSGDMAGTSPLAIAPASDWWPFRNQLLLTIAGMRATKIGVGTLLFGSVSSDGFHADGKEEFFESINRLFLIQEGRIEVAAPAVKMSTPELVHVSGIPRSLLSWSHSCHLQEFACGQCRGCQKVYSVRRELGYEND